jgi:uncharacterized protein YkwD
VDVILVIAVVWLFLLVLALAILRTAGLADRAAERRLRELQARRVSPESRRRARTAVLMVAALPLAGAAAGAGAPDATAEPSDPRCANARSAPGQAGADVTLCLINAARRARDIAPLGADALLARAAKRHAADMVARGFFSHDAPGGVSFVDRLRRVGYTSRCAWSGGEALAWGSGTTGTPASRVAAWMRSRPHREILLGPAFRDVGIGIAAGVPGGSARGFTYAAAFGRRRC